LDSKLWTWLHLDQQRHLPSHLVRVVSLRNFVEPPAHRVELGSVTDTALKPIPRQRGIGMR
jgi:hypothetical protein